MSQDIKDQVLDQVRTSPEFAIQLDEMTDVAQFSQLLMYACFMSGNSVKEEVLFHHSMESYTTATDIFQVVSNLFQENQLSCDSLVRVCTDRASAMLSLQSGFISRMKEKVHLLSVRTASFIVTPSHPELDLLK